MTLSDYNKNIGSNIRYERLKRDMTIEELSEILNIAPSFLGLIERGQRGTSLNNLCRISDFFGISLDQLILKEAGNNVKSKKQIMAEEMETNVFQKRYDILMTLINDLDMAGIEYVISTLKNMRRLLKINEYKVAEEKNNAMKDFMKIAEEEGINDGDLYIEDGDRPIFDYAVNNNLSSKNNNEATNNAQNPDEEDEILEEIHDEIDDQIFS